MMNLQMMFGLNLFRTNQVDDLLNLAFGEIIVTPLRAGLNSSSSHMWPSGLSLPTSGLQEMCSPSWIKRLKLSVSASIPVAHGTTFPSYTN